MAAKDGRGGARPGSGRKPVPADDIARMKRMRDNNSLRSIAKTLGYDPETVRKYSGQVRRDDGEE